MTLPRISVKDILFIVIGTTLMATGIVLFYLPHHMVTGGVSGLSIIIQYYTGIPLWVSSLTLNLPLFILGYRVHGRAFFFKTLFATVFFSVALFFIALLPPVRTDLTLIAVFGGVIQGVGLAMVFRCMATTGGSDMAASILHRKLPHIPMARIMFIIDAFVVMAGLFVFGVTPALYAIIAIFVTSKVIDAVQEGLSFAKAAFIISDHANEIAQKILIELSRGATALRASGLYTRKEKNVILCVVSVKELSKLKELVQQVDLKAFVIVADVREVLGEGFQEAVG